MGGKGAEERRRSRCARHPWNKKCGRRGGSMSGSSDERVRRLEDRLKTLEEVVLDLEERLERVEEEIAELRLRRGERERGRGGDME